MTAGGSVEYPGLRRSPVRRLAAATTFAGRYLSADWRPLPHFVILGTQRGGTTSLYRWLATHPDVAPALKKEVHYFDGHYDKGQRWYRAHFPLRHPGRISGESCPYLLFHPLAAGRAARDLPAETRFVVLLREPAERAVSQYWHWRQQGRYETESLERAIAFSYVARGEYAGQLRRWFDAVGRDRILVLESERLSTDRSASAEVLAFLGLSPHGQPYPVANAAQRLEETDPALMDRLRTHFEPHNQELFELLGHDLWSDRPDPPVAS
jgi:hypothetical protein